MPLVLLLTIFLWLKPRTLPEHPAEHGIVFDVVMAARVHTDTDFKAVSSLPRITPWGKEGDKCTRQQRSDNAKF